MAAQLFMKAPKAATWSAAFQPSSAVKLSVSACALRSFRVSAGRASALAVRQRPKPIPMIAPAPPTCMRSGPGFSFGFGGDQFPVRIARRHVAGESPHVGDVGDLLGIAVDDIAFLVARHRDELGLETHRRLDIAAAYFRGGDLGIVD